VNIKNSFIDKKMKDIYEYFRSAQIFGIDILLIRKSLEDTWDKAAITRENDIDPYRKGEED